MKKRIISICAAAAMVFSCAASALAAPVTQITDLIKSIPGYESSYKEVDVEIPADIELRVGNDGLFADGPVVRQVASSNIPVTFSYRATMYMQTVRDEFNDYLTAAKALINVAKVADAEVDDAALLAQLNDMPVRGEFTVKVTFPKTVTIPEGMKNGTDMYGFNEEAKAIFTEVSPRTVTTEGLEIHIAIKGSDDEESRDYITAAELYDNGEYSYLQDLVLTCSGVVVKGIGTHKIKGEVTGTIKIGDAESPVSTINYKAVQITEGHSGDAGRNPSDGIYETVKLISSGGGSGSGSGSSGNSSSPVSTPTPPISTVTPQEAESDAELNTEEHYAYIIGDENGKVRPMDNISRAEVATIFYRMFTDETRTKYWSNENAFADVSVNDWYNVAISTLSNAKVINGYDDGTFKPNASITRAEFAAIVSRMTDGLYQGYDLFDDIKNNWAREYINRAAYKGWVQGDGENYRPEDNITRAEAMTLINNVLIRHVKESGMYENMRVWSDNLSSAWYYTAVQEATNSHTYERIDDTEYERWIEPMADRDWDALEKEMADNK